MSDVAGEERHLTVSEHLANYEALVKRLERERDEYAEAAEYLLRVYTMHIDRRVQGAPVNIKTIDPIRLICGYDPCKLGRTEGEFQSAKDDFLALRLGHIGRERQPDQ